MQHRPAPDDGGVLLDEEPDRHHPDSARGPKRDDLALAVDLWLAVDPEHPRDRVAVDVAVQRAGRVTVGLEGGGEVGGQGRLADAALAGGDADHVLDLGQGALGQARPPQRLLQAALLLVAEHVEADLDRGHPLERGDLLGDRLLEVRADRAARRGQGDDDLDPAVVADLDRAHHPQLDDRAPQLGVDHGAEALGDLFLGRQWHGPIVSEGGELAAAGSWQEGCGRARRSDQTGAPGATSASSPGAVIATAALLLGAVGGAGREVPGRPVRLADRRRRGLGSERRAREVPARGVLPPPGGSDPFDGVHRQSLTRPGGGSIAAGRFARWRWVAPPGTGIVNVRGSWWSALHDGFEQRLGTGAGGDFSSFATARRRPHIPRRLRCGLPQRPQELREPPALRQSREGRRCDLGPASFAAVRSLELTLTDDTTPRPQTRRRHRRARLEAGHAERRDRRQRQPDRESASPRH